ncbi:hypothetical protein Rsub_05349 [Raphidocelis subcapitata]|uniref:DUF455 domain-containing protein n=1 Tax=Raphidocelis subcapitata TaxID=307507 RepID=A0A2V0NXB2_9CHLO|nr:hypothetical protein Rsub_05349 [Raphidocelis subcapitata]|eukprot:GBF92266.1 hypothetical protein Rsub_05349 [Raphidocelis subcapitata]
MAPPPGATAAAAVEVGETAVAPAAGAAAAPAAVAAAERPAPSQPVAPAAASLVDLALGVLHEGDPYRKAALTAAAAAAWRAGALPAAPADAADAAAAAARVPARPARHDGAVRVVPREEAARRGRGVVATMHNLTHVENWAIDLAWDAVARWGSDPRVSPHLPRAFFCDFVAIAEDEARHFVALEARLRAAGSHYGAFPVHDTLWDAAAATAHSLPARLAIEHCCHEARGLDVLPNTIAKFRAAGDFETAALLESVVYPEEVTHCAAGVRWLSHLHAAARALARGRGQRLQEQGGSEPPEGAEEAETAGEAGPSSAAEPSSSSSGGSGEGPQHAHGGGTGSSGSGLPEWAAEALEYPSPAAWFHALVRRHYGNLKGPFNAEARAKAGFTPDWYEPLVDGAARARGSGPAGAAGAQAVPGVAAGTKDAGAR